MQVVDAVPIDLNAEDLMARARVMPDTDDARLFGEMLDRARTEGRPKAVYRECFIEGRTEETVTIDGVVFTSRALARNLSDVERVFPHVATCGVEVEEIEVPPDEFLASYWWDIIKTALLMCARCHLFEVLSRRYALGKTASMNPGSGDATLWPIEQQKPLFALLGDVKSAIGVELTDSCLMMPSKTISGIAFATERDFKSCQVCHRAGCPSRSAPFDEETWKALQDL